MAPAQQQAAEPTQELRRSMVIQVTPDMNWGLKMQIFK